MRKTGLHEMEETMKDSYNTLHMIRKMKIKNQLKYTNFTENNKNFSK